MAKSTCYHADRTNQKLYFSRLAVQLAEEAPKKQQRQAQLEASVFHLYGTFLAFLQELSRFYGLNLTAPTMDQIQQLLHQQGQHSPEIEQLKQLDTDGFLAELSRAYQSCLYAPEPAAIMPEQEAGSQLIIKVTQSAQAWLPSSDILIEWQQQMQQFIAHCREQMVES